jgi:hypothetical protein
MNNSDTLPELIFDKKRSRVKLCPCGKSNKDGKFTPYVGFTDKGYCHSCGLTFLPDLPDKETKQYIFQKPKAMKTQPSPISYIPFSILKSSLKNYENNHFITFLISKFGNQTTEELVARYYIGTSKHWEAATVFYQIDTNINIRTGKIILYNHETGKRVKEPSDHIQWIHKVMKIENFNLSQCLFGEHLLKDKTKPIAIVESEKSAIIASVYFPDFLWLATGGKNNMKPELFKNLQNRKVVFFPDLKAFDLWSAKAKELGLNNYKISDLLETKASEEEKNQGLDLADYLLKYNHNQFRLKTLIKQQFSSLHPECWIIDKEKYLQLTNYNLQVLCDYLYSTYNTSVSLDEYYIAFKSLFGHSNGHHNGHRAESS